MARKLNPDTIKAEYSFSKVHQGVGMALALVKFSNYSFDRAKEITTQLLGLSMIETAIMTQHYQSSAVVFMNTNFETDNA